LFAPIRSATTLLASMGAPIPCFAPTSSKGGAYQRS
jgi:hypothetical protein